MQGEQIEGTSHKVVHALSWSLRGMSRGVTKVSKNIKAWNVSWGQIRARCPKWRAKLSQLFWQTAGAG